MAQNNTKGRMITDLNNRFTYHKPFGDQPQRYERLRAKAKELAQLADDFCPDSREKSHAMTQLEDAVMWFNAAIARNEKAPELAPFPAEGMAPQAQANPA